MPRGCGARWHLRKVTYAQAVGSGDLVAEGTPARVRELAPRFRPSPHAR